MPERGVIRNHKFAAQIRNFKELRFGTTTPTDLEAFLDFGNELFVLIESKFKDSKIPTGQLLAVERLVDAMEAAHKRALLIIAEHETEPPGELHVGLMPVRDVRFKRKWHALNGAHTCREVIDKFLERR